MSLSFYCPIDCTTNDIAQGVQNLDWCIKYGRHFTDLRTAVNFLEQRMAERAALIAETIEEFMVIRAAQNRAKNILKNP